MCQAAHARSEWRAAAGWCGTPPGWHCCRPGEPSHPGRHNGPACRNQSAPYRCALGRWGRVRKRSTGAPTGLARWRSQAESAAAPGRPCAMAWRQPTKGDLSNVVEESGWSKRDMKLRLCRGPTWHTHTPLPHIAMAAFASGSSTQARVTGARCSSPTPDVVKPSSTLDGALRCAGGGGGGGNGDVASRLNQPSPFQANRTIFLHLMSQAEQLQKQLLAARQAVKAGEVGYLLLRTAYTPSSAADFIGMHRRSIGARLLSRRRPPVPWPCWRLRCASIHAAL